MTECTQESDHLQSMYSLVCEKRPDVYTCYNPVVNLVIFDVYAILYRQVMESVMKTIRQFVWQTLTDIWRVVTPRNI